VLPRSGLGRPGLLRPPLENLTVAKLSRAPWKGGGGSRLEADRFTFCSRSPKHLGLIQRRKRSYWSMDPAWLGLNLLKRRGPYRDQVNVRGCLGYSWGRAGKETQTNWATELCQSRLGGHPDSYCLWPLSGDPVSKENFVGIQRVIGGIVDELLQGGSPPGSSILTGLKGLPLWYARMRRPGIGWIVKYQPWQLGRALDSKWWAWTLPLPIKEWWLGFWALWKIQGATFSDSVGWIRDWMPANGGLMSTRRNPMGSASGLVQTLHLLWYCRRWEGDHSAA
jgi:hypothetical protein